MTHPIDSFRAERIMIKTVKNGQFYSAGPANEYWLGAEED